MDSLFLNLTAMRQKKFFLQESEIPTQWYNITADMEHKPMPILNPVTQKPITVEELSELFSEECSRQELNTSERWIDIPEAVREKYSYYRSTPLVRAYGLEEALGTPAHSPCPGILLQEGRCYEHHNGNRSGTMRNGSGLCLQGIRT